jgi:hypothetical protein
MELRGDDRLRGSPLLDKALYETADRRRLSKHISVRRSKDQHQTQVSPSDLASPPLGDADTMDDDRRVQRVHRPQCTTSGLWGSCGLGE